MKKYIREIHKVLTPNDVGLTGSHQAGVTIPKSEQILSFFPDLPKDTFNPRVRLLFLDDASSHWFLNFIYYNNNLFGGTRNEYRLTGLTKFIRQNNLRCGDEICLFLDEAGYRFIGYKRTSALYSYEKGVLKIYHGWRSFE